jgi:hypothetical protein
MDWLKQIINEGFSEKQTGAGTVASLEVRGYLYELLVEIVAIYEKIHRVSPDLIAHLVGFLSSQSAMHFCLKIETAAIDDSGCLLQAVSIHSLVSAGTAVHGGRTQ